LASHTQAYNDLIRLANVCDERDVVFDIIEKMEEHGAALWQHAACSVQHRQDTECSVKPLHARLRYCVRAHARSIGSAA
jgi:hypothetical protein